jgi:hypothetical protein
MTDGIPPKGEYGDLRAAEWEATLLPNQKVLVHQPRPSPMGEVVFPATVVHVAHQSVLVLSDHGGVFVPRRRAKNWAENCRLTPFKEGKN